MHRRALAGPSGATPVHPCCLLGFPFLSAPTHAHLLPPVNTVSRYPFNICPFLPTASMLLSLPSAPGLAQQPPRSPLHSAGCPLAGGVVPLLRICSMNSKMLSSGPLHLTGPWRTPYPHLQTVQYIPVYFSNMPGMLSSTSGPRIVCPLISQRLISLFH